MVSFLNVDTISFKPYGPPNIGNISQLQSWVVEITFHPSELSLPSYPLLGHAGSWKSFIC